ncbi:peptidyl-alpha-hydroxyglycine alpha-amidating lyase family protein [Chloroflexota bacterium]
MLYGTGKYRYELVDGWAKLPEGWSLDSVPGLFVDSQDRVYVLNRGPHPVMVFDREGNLLTSLGEGFFTHPNGICVGPDGSVYATDEKNHTLSKFTPDGKLLMTLGNKDQPSDTGYVEVPKSGPAGDSTIEELDERLAMIKRSGPPFDRPTDVALSSSGEIYVSDGFGIDHDEYKAKDARVHKFTPDGTLLFSWGEPGTAPGQFRIPHGIWVDRQERVWVCDPHNRRVQTFNAQGEFLSQLADLGGQASSICIDNEETVYVSEIRDEQGVSIFTIDGKRLACWATVGQPHAIAVDSRGDLYIGETSGSRAVQKFARRD